MDNNAVITWERIEEFSGYSRRTLLRLIRERGGPPIREVAGKVVLLKDEWYEWLKDQPPKYCSPRLIRKNRGD